MKSATPELFRKHVEATRVYDELMAFVRTLGKFKVEEKKTCVHVVAGKAAFLGVHPRKSGVRITVVLGNPVDSDRIAKCEKASANRYHIDLDISGDQKLDKNVRSWIAESYKRSNSSSL